MCLASDLSRFEGQDPTDPESQFHLARGAQALRLAGFTEAVSLSECVLVN